MEDKKPRVLDVLRLIWSIFILIVSIVAVIGILIGVSHELMAGHGDGYWLLVSLFAIPAFIAIIAIFCLAIKGIKKYNKIKDIPLVNRDTSISEPVIKICVTFFLFVPVFILFGLYWICDLIEAVKCDNLKKELNIISESKINTDETNPVNDNQYCENCGKQIDANAKFCKYCGKSIK